MDAVANSEELGIFKTDMIKDMIDYKWKTFARRQHLLGGFIHVVYVFVMIAYINHTFLQSQAIFANELLDISEQTNEEVDNRIFPRCEENYMIALAVCLLYPVYYDGTQLIKQGSNYFLFA